MVYILLGLSVILIGLIGAGFYFYQVAVARGNKPFLENDPDLEVDGDIDLSTQEDKNWWKKQHFTKWTQKTTDNLTLTGYFLSPENETNKVAIIAHGYAGDAKTMSGFARLYHEVLGMHVLVPDARGHGESEGDYIGFGWHERLDYKDWIDKVTDFFDYDVEIVLHGVSMGSATVLMASGESLPDQVKAIVADCGYTSAMEELAYQMKRMYHLPAFPILHVTSLITKWRTGYAFQEASVLKQVQQTNKPILFVHGEEDAFVPKYMVEVLYKAALTTNKELLLIPDAGHGLAYQTDQENYRQVLLRFVNKYLSSNDQKAL
ncbi:Alpha/beta hydrolase family protein [Paraliobacillus sp. PM-2]|uniref:alpha/beta hydrolase n=1 Tax=Paraliobacillus sp. PM-2 TaxID=1462524 RepID=UPI00061CBBA0|nr:alpha/beta hydrolase [Paraliobacillus sp. PM-2]CQR47123.1 Alpha/beta hydrolase family protein [Paraliobacillus sp. PM-2]